MHSKASTTKWCVPLQTLDTLNCRYRMSNTNKDKWFSPPNHLLLGRDNVMYLNVEESKRLKRKPVQEHCCIPLHNKGLSSLLRVVSLWRSLDLIWLNRLYRSSARLVSAATIWSWQINAEEMRAHVKIYHSEGGEYSLSSYLQHCHSVFCLVRGRSHLPLQFSPLSPFPSLYFLSSPPLHMHTLILRPPPPIFPPILKWDCIEECRADSAEV